MAPPIALPIAPPPIPSAILFSEDISTIFEQVKSITGALVLLEFELALGF